MHDLGKTCRVKRFPLRKPSDTSLALRRIKPLVDGWLNGLTLFHSGVLFSDVSTEASQ
jgi:hypothetical protein